ncbi:hypothetical protein GCM10027569_38550 [Flindersiella endophytica]
MVGVRHLGQRAELAKVSAEPGGLPAARVREFNQQLVGELPRSSRATSDGSHRPK